MSLKLSSFARLVGYNACGSVCLLVSRNEVFIVINRPSGGIMMVMHATCPRPQTTNVVSADDEKLNGVHVNVRVYMRKHEA